MRKWLVLPLLAILVVACGGPDGPLGRVGRSRIDETYVVEVGDGYAYVGHNDGISIIDVRDPSLPKHVADIPAQEIVSGVYLRDGLAYVAAGGELIVADVSDPSRPEVMGRLGSERPRTSSWMALMATSATIRETSTSLIYRSRRLRGWSRDGATVAEGRKSPSSQIRSTWPTPRLG
jgi:hypothetical protein